MDFHQCGIFATPKAVPAARFSYDCRKQTGLTTRFRPVIG